MARTSNVTLFVRHLIKQQMEAGEKQAALARRVGTSSQAINQIYNEARGVGPDTEPGFARVFADGSIDKLRAQADAWVAENLQSRTEARVEYEAPARPVFGNLPGWGDAEREARKRYRFVPDEAWAEAREVSGMRAPSVVTPEFVYDIASLCMKYSGPSAPPSLSPEQAATDRAEHERLEKMHEEIQGRRRGK